MNVVKTKLFYTLGESADETNYNERLDDLGDYDGTALMKAFYDKKLTKSAGLFQYEYINIQNRNQLTSGIVDNYLNETLYYYKPAPAAAAALAQEQEGRAPAKKKQKKQN